MFSLPGSSDIKTLSRSYTPEPPVSGPGQSKQITLEEAEAAAFLLLQTGFVRPNVCDGGVVNL